MLTMVTCAMFQWLPVKQGSGLSPKPRFSPTPGELPAENFILCYGSQSLTVSGHAFHSWLTVPSLAHGPPVRVVVNLCRRATS